MAYIPPNRRNKELKNIIVEKKDNLPIEDDFPELGSVVDNNKSSMNFAASISKIQPKKEIIKEIPDGWVSIIKEKNKPPKYRFGDSRGQLQEVLDLAHYMKESRIQNALWKLEARLDYNQALDEYLNGPKYVSGYEISLMMKEEERKRKQEMKELESSSDESEYETENFELE